MTAADLCHRVTIQAPTETADGTGQPVPAWADERTVWGRFEAQGAFEAEAGGQQVRSIVAGTVALRAVPGLSAKKRLVVNGYGITALPLNVVGVKPPDPVTGLVVLLVREPDSGREPS